MRTVSNYKNSKRFPKSNVYDLLSSVPPLSIHLPSPLTSPLVLQPTGSVGAAQQTVRTVAIVVEEEDKEEFGGSDVLFKEDEEEGVLVQEAEELDDQLGVPPSQKEI